MRGVRDAWFVGLVPGEAAVVWIGHDEGAPVAVPGAEDEGKQLRVAEGLGVLLDELSLYNRWATDSQARIRSSADRAEAWPASKDDIEALYMTRAYAQVASQMLMSSLIQEPELIRTADVREARDRAIFAWRRAATFNPIMVSSQAGTGSILSDHPAAMMFDFDAHSEFFYDYQHEHLVQSVLVCEGFNVAMSGGWDWALVLHNLSTGRTIKKLEMKSGPLKCLLGLGRTVAVADSGTPE